MNFIHTTASSSNTIAFFYKNSLLIFVGNIPIQKKQNGQVNDIFIYLMHGKPNSWQY
jgi:hypothetical protein